MNSKWKFAFLIIFTSFLIIFINLVGFILKQENKISGNFVSLTTPFVSVAISLIAMASVVKYGSHYDYEKELFKEKELPHGLIEKLNELYKRVSPYANKKQLNRFPKDVYKIIVEIYNNEDYRKVLYDLEYSEKASKLFEIVRSILISLDKTKHGHYNEGRKAYNLRKLRQETEKLLKYVYSTGYYGYHH